MSMLFSLIFTLTTLYTHSVFLSLLLPTYLIQQNIYCQDPHTHLLKIHTDSTTPESVFLREIGVNYGIPPQKDHILMLANWNVSPSFFGKVYLTTCVQKEATY